MKQTILCLLGLTAMVVMCSSEPLAKRQRNFEEMSVPTTENPEEPENPDSSNEKPKSSKGDTAYPDFDRARGKKEVCFKECRKIQRSGLTAACNDDEIAVGCETTGFDGCGASQADGGQGCMVDSCRDFSDAHWSGVIKAVCCKRNAVQVV